jgi:hypothetical protein
METGYALQPHFTRTTDHATIRRWVEQYHGRPMQKKGTSGGEDENEPGDLKISFAPTSETPSLESIAWERFFDKFDRANLAFAYPPDGNGVCRFVPRRDGEGEPIH